MSGRGRAARQCIRLGAACALAALTGICTVPRASAAPDEELLGKSAGYPVGTPRTWFFDERVRVGSFSRLDTFLPHNKLRASATPTPLKPPPPRFELNYRFENEIYSVRDFLDRQRVTGLLLIKDRDILFERYQYGRAPSDRFVSHSMAKSITSLAVGFALQEGRIASLDDTAAKYHPGLKGSAYGETRLRDLLRMSSGVTFKELYDGKDDSARFARLRREEGAVMALRAFSDRESKPGSRFKYASPETVVLAAVLRAVTGQTLSAYLETRLWQPMGAEADASWIKDRGGLEAGSGAFNAVLRDYGRLGVLLAADGALGERQILPRDYLLEATDWRRHPEAFQPRRATPYFGYGYQFWLYPGSQRRFALLGVYGQSMHVDPTSKLVMVVTAVAKNARVSNESFARERSAVWNAFLAKYSNREP